MKPTHYHITNTFSAVTLYKDPNKDIIRTSDGYKADSIDLKPISDLIGVQVTRVGWTGHIVDFLSDERGLIDGKYLEHSKRYLSKSEFMNAQVGVLWDNSKDLKNCRMIPYWSDFSKLKLL